MRRNNVAVLFSGSLLCLCTQVYQGVAFRVRRSNRAHNDRGTIAFHNGSSQVQYFAERPHPQWEALRQQGGARSRWRRRRTVSLTNTSLGRGAARPLWSRANTEKNTNETEKRQRAKPTALFIGRETLAADRSAASWKVAEDDARADFATPQPTDDGGKTWHISTEEGGSSKALEWRKEKGGGWGAWFASISFLFMLGISPIIPHLRKGAKPMTKWHYMETGCYFVWLIAGYVCFTQKIVFQSPHFRTPRTLSTEEAVYLIAQIVTTVGYGDITPAKADGQMFVGFFVFFAIMFVSKMLGEMVALFQDMMEDMIMDDPVDGSLSQGVSPGRKLWNAFVPVIQAGVVALIFWAIGVVFYWVCPGEGKTLQQAVYMSIITLSSVGFGAFTPSTHAGMVFGAYWMLFGVGAMASFVSARMAFHRRLVHNEQKQREPQTDRAGAQ